MISIVWSLRWPTNWLIPTFPTHGNLPRRSKPRPKSPNFHLIQARRLLLEPLAAVATEHDPGPIIIILDALDECGTAQSSSSLQRFTDGLTKFPKTFRILVGSRDGPDIRVAFSRPNIDIRDVKIDDESAMQDISRFFQYEFARFAA